MKEGQGTGTVQVAAKEPRSISFRWKQYGEAQAFQRAAIVWAVIWLAGLATIFIPLVHFLTVPAALISGPIAFSLVRKLYAGGIDIFAPTGACPACEAPLQWDGTRAWTRSIDFRCAACGERASLISERPE